MFVGVGVRSHRSRLPSIPPLRPPSTAAPSDGRLHRNDLCHAVHVVGWLPTRTDIIHGKRCWLLFVFIS